MALHRTAAIKLTKCDGTVECGPMFLGKGDMEFPTDHPYVVERQSFRADTRTFHPEMGCYLDWGGKVFRAQNLSFTSTACRAIISGVRVAFSNCDLAMADLYEADPVSGCDSEDAPRLIVSQVPARIQHAQSSEAVSNDRKDWVERFRIYVDPSWGSLLNWNSWIKIGDDWYEVQELVDRDRYDRMPYAGCVKENPPWTVSVQ